MISLSLSFIEFMEDKRNILFFIGLLVGLTFALIINWFSDKILHPQKKKRKEREKVVVVGSGWAGLSFVKEIDTSMYDVTFISPRDYFLFTPLLSNVTVGKLDTTCILEPIRKYLARVGKTDVTFYEGSCTDIDPVKKIIKCTTVEGNIESTIPFDKLVLTVGGTTNTFGIKGVEEHCHFLKDLQDSRSIRNKILTCFEISSIPNQSLEAIKKLLHFVVVGSGPTSIQFAQQLHELLHDLEIYYPTLLSNVKVTFVNTKEHKLNTYDEKITEYYMKTVFKHACKEMVVTESKIKSVTKDAITLDKEGKLPYGICIWLTGNRSSDLIQNLKRKKPDLQHNQTALITDEYLQVKGFDGIYAAGECATIDQVKLLQRWTEIFKALDDNNDGYIDAEEFKNLTQIFSRQYPQLLEFSKQATKMFEEADVNKDGKLTEEEFRLVLAKVDSSLTSFPSSAQSAQQQGRYLGQSFSKILQKSDLLKLFAELDKDKSGKLDIQEVRSGLRKLGLPHSKKDVLDFIAESDSNKDGTVDQKEFIEFALRIQQQGGTGDWKKLSHAKILPFRYKHLGGYEYIGYQASVTERGSQGRSIIDGFGAWWMWRSIFVSRMVSGRSKVQMLIDWFLSLYHGRDFTRY